MHIVVVILVAVVATMMMMKHELKLFLHNFVSLGQILMIFLGRHKLLN
jgi:hypothetical protein